MYNYTINYRLVLLRLLCEKELLSFLCYFLEIILPVEGVGCERKMKRPTITKIPPANSPSVGISENSNQAQRVAPTGSPKIAVETREGET